MVEYNSESIYIDSASSLQEKIERCDAIITALFDAALKTAARQGVSEYSLDDGQTKIKTVYRDTAAVMAAINVFERMKTYYENKLNGRAIRLVDGKNLYRP